MVENEPKVAKSKQCRNRRCDGAAPASITNATVSSAGQMHFALPNMKGIESNNKEKRFEVNNHRDGVSVQTQNAMTDSSSGSRQRSPAPAPFTNVPRLIACKAYPCGTGLLMVEFYDEMTNEIYKGALLRVHSNSPLTPSLLDRTMLNRMREVETAEAERQAAIVNDEQLPTRTRRLVQSRQLSLTAARVTYNLDGRADTFDVYEDRSRQTEERRRRAALRRERRAKNGYKNDEASTITEASNSQASQTLPTISTPRVVPTKVVTANVRENPRIRVQQGRTVMTATTKAARAALHRVQTQCYKIRGQQKAVARLSAGMTAQIKEGEEISLKALITDARPNESSTERDQQNTLLCTDKSNLASMAPKNRLEQCLAKINRFHDHIEQENENNAVRSSSPSHQCEKAYVKIPKLEQRLTKPSTSTVHKPINGTISSTSGKLRAKIEADTNEPGYTKLILPTESKTQRNDSVASGAVPAKRARSDNTDKSVKVTPKRSVEKLKNKPHNKSREERQAEIPTESTLNPKAYCADDLLWVQQSKKGPHFPCTVYSYERISGRWVVVWCGDNRHSVEKWSDSKFREFLTDFNTVYNPFHNSDAYQSAVVAACQLLPQEQLEALKESLERNPFTYQKLFGQFPASYPSPPKHQLETQQAEAQFYREHRKEARMQLGAFVNNRPQVMLSERTKKRQRIAARCRARQNDQTAVNGQPAPSRSSSSSRTVDTSTEVIAGE